MSFWYFSDGRDNVAAWSTLSVGLFLFLLRMPTTSIQGNYVIASNCFIIFFIILIFISVKFRFLANANLGFFPYLGRVSYVLYLIHQEVGVLIIGRLKKCTPIGDMWAASMALAVCLLLSALVYQFVEKPGQSFLRGLTWRRVKPHGLPQTL